MKARRKAQLIAPKTAEAYQRRLRILSKMRTGGNPIRMKLRQRLRKSIALTPLETERLARFREVQKAREEAQEARKSHHSLTSELKKTKQRAEQAERKLTRTKNTKLTRAQIDKLYNVQTGTINAMMARIDAIPKDWPEHRRREVIAQIRNEMQTTPVESIARKLRQYQKEQAVHSTLKRAGEERTIELQSRVLKNKTTRGIVSMHASRRVANIQNRRQLYMSQMMSNVRRLFDRARIPSGVRAGIAVAMMNAERAAIESQIAIERKRKNDAKSSKTQGLDGAYNELLNVIATQTFPTDFSRKLGQAAQKVRDASRKMVGLAINENGQTNYEEKAATAQATLRAKIEEQTSAIEAASLTPEQIDRLVKGLRNMRKNTSRQLRRAIGTHMAKDAMQQAKRTRFIDLIEDSEQ